jgi:hypothetical protein
MWIFRKMMSFLTTFLQDFFLTPYGLKLMAYEVGPLQFKFFPCCVEMLSLERVESIEYSPYRELLPSPARVAVS